MAISHLRSSSSSFPIKLFLLLLFSIRHHLNPSVRTRPVTRSSPSDKVKTESTNSQNGCVFCKIIRGESSCLQLYEDAMCLCILDTNPLSHGHSLIIPKLHYPTLEETPPLSILGLLFI